MPVLFKRMDAWKEVLISLYEFLFDIYKSEDYKNHELTIVLAKLEDIMDYLDENSSDYDTVVADGEIDKLIEKVSKYILLMNVLEEDE